MATLVERLLDAGIASAQRHDLIKAAEQFRAASKLDPQCVAALVNLGAVAWATGDRDAAVEAFETALIIDPNTADAHISLGVIYAELGRYDDAIKRMERGIRGAPSSYAYTNLGVLYRLCGQRHQALRAFEAALALEPGKWRLRGDRGIELLVLGKFDEGWAEYEARREGDTYAAYNVRPDSPLWHGEAIEHLLIHYEQGFGDTIQNARFIRLAAQRCNRISLMVHAELRDLMRTSFPDGNITVIDSLPEHYDGHVWIDSLPQIFQAGVEPIPSPPYLHVPRSEFWSKRFAHLAGMKVGLVWAGQTGQDFDRRRSMALAQFEPILNLPRISFVSLQRDATDTDPRLLDISADLTDWAATAAAIHELDLVIAVDTAVAHLAGALNKPVWLMNRLDTCWRWLLDRSDSPWYPSMRIFRQPAPGDWGSVVQAAANALTDES